MIDLVAQVINHGYIRKETWWLSQPVSRSARQHKSNKGADSGRYTNVVPE